MLHVVAYAVAKHCSTRIHIVHTTNAQVVRQPHVRYYDDAKARTREQYYSCPPRELGRPECIKKSCRFGRHVEQVSSAYGDFIPPLMVVQVHERV
jgi:hypothetical protein